MTFTITIIIILCILGVFGLYKGTTTNKVKIILELRLKTPQNNNINIYRKKATINIVPFPGLVIDDDSNFKKNNRGIAEHQIIVEQVRTSMISDSILCYCKSEHFETEKLLLKQIALLNKLKWDAAGYPG